MSRGQFLNDYMKSDAFGKTNKPDQKLFLCKKYDLKRYELIRL